jgi:hypothetical protein
MQATVCPIHEVAEDDGGKMFEGSDGFFDETHFKKMFDLERKRTQRSGTPFIFVLIHIAGLEDSCPTGRLKNLQKALTSSFRETDFRGWYRQQSVIGIIFTDLQSVGEDTRAILFGKLLDALASRIEPDELRAIYITFHTYPTSREDAVSCGRFDLRSYPAPQHQVVGTQFLPRMRRIMKATGPLAALLKFLP